MIWVTNKQDVLNRYLTHRHLHNLFGKHQYVNTCFKIKEVGYLISLFCETFRRNIIWLHNQKYTKIVSLDSIHEFVSAESSKITTFSESLKRFWRSLWIFLDIVLTAVWNNRKIRRQLLIAQWETTIQNYRSTIT